MSSRPAPKFGPRPAVNLLAIALGLGSAAHIYSKLGTSDMPRLGLSLLLAAFGAVRLFQWYASADR